MPSIKVEKLRDSVYVKYTHKGRVLKIDTGVKLHDIFWNQGVLPDECPERDNISSKIRLVENRLLEASMLIRNLGTDPTPEKVQCEYHTQEIQNIKSVDLWDKINKSIKKMKSDYGRRIAEKLKESFMRFCLVKGYSFKQTSWDLGMLGNYIQYLLIHEEQEDYDIALMVDALKIFIMDAYPENEFNWMRYDPIEHGEELFSLNEGELKCLIDSELGGYIEEARDLFVFLATSGMRYHESQVPNPGFISKEEMQRFSELNPAWKQFPPYFEVSRRILIKYDRIPPQMPLTNFHDLIKELFTELRLKRAVPAKTGKNMEDIVKLTPLCEAVTVETARRTFITNCFLKGIPIGDVMLMAGHNDYRTIIPLFRHTRTLWGTPLD
jgi:hypothetical protein